MADSTTLDQSSQASHPGGIKPSLIKWFAHYPKWPMIWLGSLLLSIGFAIFVHWAFWLTVAFFLWANRFYWRRFGDHFMHGCANPAVVVNMEPLLIATATDLTKGIDAYPAIKIVEKSLKTVHGKAPVLGARLVTVALYGEDPNDDGSSPHWGTFDPRPVDCVTSDQAAMDRLMAGFDDEDWQNLDKWLATIPKPRTPGLYMIDQG